MFVTDEETGGNGSLSIVLDEELKRHYRLSPLEGQDCSGYRLQVWGSSAHMGAGKGCARSLR